MSTPQSVADVYFTDMRCPMDYSLLTKMKKLLRAAGLDALDVDGKFVAIKMHFGEPGNLAFLRPNFARCVADMIRERGGLPFLTDCSTLYVGRRKHALEHLAAAQENGFNPLSVGCQLLIGDGLKGTDDVEVPVPNGEIFKTARIGSVEPTDTPWQHAEEHREGFIDAFRIHGERRHRVRLELGLLAYNLLCEEYPLAERDVRPLGRGRWLLDTEVANFTGVGRFVVGLLDDIRVVDTPELTEHIRNYITENLK